MSKKDIFNYLKVLNKTKSTEIVPKGMLHFEDSVKLLQERDVKEILEALKPHDKEFEKAGIKEYSLVLSVKEQKILLDYITNLQEYYNDNVNKYEELIIKYSDLQEENEKLQKRNKQIYDGFTAAIEEVCEYATRCEELEKEIEIYKLEKRKGIDKNEI